MASSAPYEVNVSGSDDETFAFAVPFEMNDGSPFNFADYIVEYSLSGRGPRLLLTEGDGITVADGVVTIKANRGRLSPGVYSHGCRLRQISTGDEFQVWDGTVTISEGQFR